MKSHLIYLKALQLSGAHSRHDAEAHLGPLEFRRMVRERQLLVYPTELGKAVVLDTEGRKQLGMFKHVYRSPDEVLNELYLLEGIKHLAQKGFVLQGKVARNVWQVESPQGDRFCVYGQFRGVTAGAVRKVLRRHQHLLFQQQARLMVLCRSRKPYSQLLDHTGEVELEPFVLQRLRPTAGNAVALLLPLLEAVPFSPAAD